MIGELKRKFETDGYAILEDFLTNEEADELKLEAMNLLKNMPTESERVIFSAKDTEAQQSKNDYFLESGDKVRYFFESDAVGQNGQLLVEPEMSVNKIGHGLHLLTPAFRKITLDERIKEACFQLGLQEPAIVQSMYIFKNPRIGGEVQPHQDATYLYTEPMNVVGFWIAIDDATLENGCLWMAKGSHKSGVHRRYIRNPDKTSEDLLIYTSPSPYYQKSNFTAVPVKKGTCVLIHGQVVHESEQNRSDKSRHAYTFHIIETKNTKYSKDNWNQPLEGNSFSKLYRQLV